MDLKIDTLLKPKLIIDTNIWIEVIRGKIILDDLLEKCSDYSIVSSVVIYSELQAGVYRFPNNNLQSSIIENIFDLITITYEINHEVADKTAEIYAIARKRGLGHNTLNSDYYIASTCIINKACLLTLNTKDFDFIEGLDLLKF